MPTTLTPLGNELWTATTEQPLGGGVRLPATMIIARDDDRLAVISPLRLETGWPDLVSALGELAFLVAPNLFHHLHLGKAAARFPEARVCGPRALARKRGDIDFAAFLEDGPPAGWPESIEIHEIAGAPRVSEHFFYHRPSRSLTVGDLLFNIERPPDLRTRIFLGLAGGWDRSFHARLWRWFLVKDRAAFCDSLDAAAELELERLIPLHGEPILDPGASLGAVTTPGGGLR
jgi:hypothetical protein